MQSKPHNILLRTYCWTYCSKAGFLVISLLLEQTLQAPVSLWLSMSKYFSYKSNYGYTYIYFCAIQIVALCYTFTVQIKLEEIDRSEEERTAFAMSGRVY